MILSMLVLVTIQSITAAGDDVVTPGTGDDSIIGTWC